jgi:AraC family transcriptional regulator
MGTVADEMARLLDKPPQLVPASVRARLKACSEMIAGDKPVELLDRVGCTDPTVVNLLEILSREASADDASARLFVERTIDLLCMQLLRHHSGFNARTPQPHRGLARWQVKLVTTYMRDHLDQEIGLDDLAKLVHLSRFHFCTAFRLATGRTPHEWLVAQRIERARDLLAQTVLPVAEVGLAVGYVTPSSFAASFRKLVGATPSEFRRRL